MEQILSWDFSVLNFIQEHFRCDALDWLTQLFSTIGHAGIVWIVISVIFIFFKKTRAAGVIGLLSMGLGLLLGEFVIKNIVARPRPFLTDDPRNLFLNAELIVKKPSGYSFPSGHSCAAAAFGTVLLAKNKVLGLVFLVPVLYMMFSRCYAYVHFPTDVLAGMLLGILCAVVVLIIFRATKLDRRLSGRK
ncbi:MAG: phosphatase PAP2 family protein [Ruminococcus sp.]|nr:phosphatase PAP2 family protein [Ruminococcus sp.]MBQ1807558.1 phosphatase PAP2 family protein [Ruminococcus sp.]MBQ5640628.1 phosphatase PAP2 family protein [Ruminococcus sp.]